MSLSVTESEGGYACVIVEPEKALYRRKTFPSSFVKQIWKLYDLGSNKFTSVRSPRSSDIGLRSSLSRVVYSSNMAMFNFVAGLAIYQHYPWPQQCLFTRETLSSIRKTFRKTWLGWFSCLSKMLHHWWKRYVKKQRVNKRLLVVAESW